MPNPIKSVGGDTDIPCPSSYIWELEDVSGKGAGRTEKNVKMNKMRIGQVSAFELTWQGLTTAQANKVLTAFNPEYIWANLLDPLIGGYTGEIEFYVGNRTSALFDANRGLWNDLGFRIISRGDINA